MNQKLIVRRCLIILAIFVLPMATALPIRARYDPPKPPPISVWVRLNDIKFNEKMVEIGEDWWGGADLFVRSHVKQEGHPESEEIRPLYEANFDLDKSDPWVPNQLIYNNDECTPMTEVKVFFEVKEVDAGILEALGAVATGVGAIVTIKIPPLSAALSTVSVTLTGIAFNSADKVGATDEKRSEEGTFTTDWTMGGEGGRAAKITYTITEFDLDGPECDEEAYVPPTHYSPEDRTAVNTAFTHWREAVALAGQIQAEPESGLTPQEIEADRQTLVNAVLDSVDVITEALVSSIESEPDAYSQASQDLSDARNLRDVSIDQAMDSYESAALVTIDTLIALYPIDVGGIGELPVEGWDAPGSAAQAPGSSSPPYAAIAGGAAAAALAFTAGGWYARRRWLG